jgi:hypothetical protein
MSRAPTIVFAFLILATAIVAALLIAREQTLPSAAQAALDKYVLYRQSLPSASAMVEQVTRAAFPSNFSADMSNASYGHSHLYRTTQDDREPRAVNLTHDALTTLSVQYVGADRPIPFPPADLWCVLLKHDHQQQVAFVALHQDLYNADWLVHEPRAAIGTRTLSDQLARLGCNLKLESSE